MDWPRYLKAMEAGNVEGVEERREAYINGKLTKLDAGEWETIKEHDRIWADISKLDD